MQMLITELIIKKNIIKIVILMFTRTTFFVTFTIDNIIVY